MVVAGWLVGLDKVDRDNLKSTEKIKEAQKLLLSKKEGRLNEGKLDGRLL